MAACLFSCLGHSPQKSQEDDEIIVLDGEEARAGSKRPRRSLSKSSLGARSSRELEVTKRSCRADWTCDSCTFINDGTTGDVCEACNGPRAARGGGASQQQPGPWQCTHCTFLNDEGARICEICHKSPGAATSAADKAEEVSDGETLQEEANTAGPSSSNPGLDGKDVYVLDLCGCRFEREDLAARISQAAASLPVNLGAILSFLVCPTAACRQPLSRNDLCNLASANDVQKVDARIGAAALREAAFLARRTRNALQHFAALPMQCPFCEGAPGEGAPEMPMVAAVAASLKAGDVQAALRVRGVARPGRALVDAAAQLRALCTTMGAAHLCLTCPAGISKATGEIISTAEDGISLPGASPARSASGAGPSGDCAAAEQAKQCLQLCSVIHRLHGTLTARATAPAASGAAPSSRPAARGRGGAGNGTGYGGNRGHSWGHKSEANPGAAQAAQRQEGVDQELTAQLAELRGLLSQPGGRRGGMPLGLCALAGAPCLAAALRRLLQNDSLLDIGARRALYLELCLLLRTLGSHVELLPALQRPADFDEALALSRCVPLKKSATEAAAELAAPSVMHALTTLNTQCTVFKRSAEALADGEEADIDALSIALEISATYDQLSESVALYKTTLSAVAQPPAPEALAEGGTALVSPMGKRRASAATAKVPLEVLQKRYMDLVEPLRFRDFDLIGSGAFYFRDTAKQTNTGGKAWLRRIAQEQSSLATCLPVSWRTSIFVAVDSARMDVLRALIIGPEDTPYADGCFLFDILLPPEYPNQPPKVQFLTTGGGRARFNPNLYACGKVCLSLLGTWNGPSWIPGKSTILQVLISIQSMILVKDPYFNEPGFEASRGSPQGMQRSREYNATIQRYTAQHAILDALQKPNAAFADVIREHFRQKRAQILTQCASWLPKHDSTINSIAAALDKL